MRPRIHLVRWLTTLGLALSSVSCDPASQAASRPASATSQPDNVPAPPIEDEPDRLPEPAAPPEPPVVYEPSPEDLFVPEQPIDDPSGTALDPFYAALAELDEGGTLKVRVTHIGDSSIGLDGLTKTLRERMQARFGDGGPGFLLMSRYQANYRPATVDFRAFGWSFCYIANGCRGDGRYGLGGVTFSGDQGARTLIETREPTGDGFTAGTRFSKVELWLSARPHGGRLSLRVDGQLIREVPTAADQEEDRWESFEIEDGPHRLEIRNSGAKTRAYGVVLETEGPGLVWDAMSMIGAFTRRLRNWDEEHISRQIAHRDPQLLVFNYGGNDLRRVVAAGLTKEAYKEEYREVLHKVRAGKPEAACLLVGVIDHGRSGQQTVQPQHVDVIISAQKELAAEEGCAFFNSYQAMGGPGSMHRWRKLQPPLAEPDLKHLNNRGRARMAGMMYEALMTGYVDYRRRRAAEATGSP